MLWCGSTPFRATCSKCCSSTRNCGNQEGGSTDDTSHPISPIVCCRVASRDLSLPQRRRCHTKGTPQNIQSRCSGRPDTGRASEDVSPCSSAFPHHMFQVLLMAKKEDGRRRGRWSQARQTRRYGDTVWPSNCSAAYEGKSTSLPLGHHTRTFAAHIAFDEHAKSRRCPGRHTALVKDLAVLRSHEVQLRLWPCSGQERGH